MSRHRLPGLLLASVLLGAAPLARQEPKLGSDWYADEVDLGFKVRAPKDWQYVPSSPLEPNIIGKYAASNGQFVNLGNEAFVLVTLYLVKFDQRPRANEPEKRQMGDKTVEVTVTAASDIEAWMTGGIDEGMNWHRVEAPKPLKGLPVKASTSIYEGRSNRGRPGAEGLVRAHVTSGIHLLLWCVLSSCFGISYPQ